MPTKIPQARIALCELILHEVDDLKMHSITEFLFGDCEEVWSRHGTESPYQRWYREMSSLSATENSPGGGKTRQVVWKTGKPFMPQFLFFRTIDTGRLLPANNAGMRVQFYAHKSHWEHLDSIGKRDWWITTMLIGMMHELLVLRNRRDKGGADIPIIITTWDQDQVDMSVHYWVELSKGQWSKEEHIRQYEKCVNSFCRRLMPTFAQVDLLVRSLFLDPEVGFAPPFLVIMPLQKSNDPRARVLYANPSNVPPRWVLERFPKTCGTPQCSNPECGFIDLTMTRALSAGSAMVRDDPWPQAAILCNMWMCEAPHAPEHGRALLQCQKCKEAFYCCSMHQSIDWQQHKDVCQAKKNKPQSAVV